MDLWVKALCSVADMCRQLIELLPSLLAPSGNPNADAEERISPIQFVVYFDEAHSLLIPFYTVHNSQHPKT